MIAEQWNLTRDDLDEFAVRSPQECRTGRGRRSLRQRDHPGRGEGRRGRRHRRDLRADEGIRPDSSVEVLANLKPAFRQENGKVTAGQLVTDHRRRVRLC